MGTKKWLRLVAPVALVALGATACSSGNGAAVDAWANTVCQGMQNPVKQANTALADTGAVKTGESPKALQARLAADFGTLATANTQIAQAVQKAGAPKVTNGAQLQADALSELDQAAGGYTGVQKSVQGLAVNDQAKFAAGLQGVGDQVQRLAELSTSALQKLQTGDLGTALSKQPGCSSESVTGTVDTAAPPAATPSATGTGKASGGTSGKASTRPSATASGKSSG